MSALSIRAARLPDDRDAILAFIDGLQHFEHTIEPDRRIDAAVAAEFFDQLMGRVKSDGGAALIAEEEGRAIGWAVVLPQENDVYVVAEERRYAYISELYIDEDARGAGVGRALVAACEDWARARGFPLIKIGVLPGNVRAEKIYRLLGYDTYALSLRKYLR
jgi:GNAT superfamily N-acetyltransferase